MADKQAVFNKVVAHLHAQGTRSCDDRKHFCVYRGANGMKCAVGALIPDEHYNPKAEGAPVSALLHPSRYDDVSQEQQEALRGMLERSGFSKEDYPFLLALQKPHDNADNGAGFWPFVRPRYIKVATEFGLDPGVIPE